MFIITIQFAVHRVSLYCAPHHRCLVIITANQLFSGFVENCLKSRRKCAQKNASHSTRLMFIQHSSKIMPFLFIQNMIVIRRSVILHWIVCDIFLRFHPQKHLAKLVPNSFILISFLWGHFLRVRFYFFIAIAVVMAWKSLY